MVNVLPKMENEWNGNNDDENENNENKKNSTKNKFNEVIVLFYD
jgi:hypothetical protein